MKWIFFSERRDVTSEIEFDSNSVYELLQIKVYHLHQTLSKYVDEKAGKHVSVVERNSKVMVSDKNANVHVSLLLYSRSWQVRGRQLKGQQVSVELSKQTGERRLKVRRRAKSQEPSLKSKTVRNYGPELSTRAQGSTCLAFNFVL